MPPERISEHKPIQESGWQAKRLPPASYVPEKLVPTAFRKFVPGYPLEDFRVGDTHHAPGNVNQERIYASLYLGSRLLEIFVTRCDSGF